MSRFTHIDLGALAFPDVIETLEFETMLSEMRTTLLAAYPAVNLESEPLIALIEVCAYYRMLDRARVNDAAKAVMLSLATGSNLENLGAFYGAQRLLVTPGNPDANPPTPPVYETDEAFRSRIQLAIEAQSTAGPKGAYLYWALAADGQVRDASVMSPAPGTVRVSVLSQDGAPSQEILDRVYNQLNDEEVRPLTDTVQVVPAVIRNYSISATLTFFFGPDTAVVITAARAAVEAYVEQRFRLGHDITRSGIFAALHQPGVQNVILAQPAADIVIAAGEAPRITTISIVNGGISV